MRDFGGATAGSSLGSDGAGDEESVFEGFDD